MALQHIVVFLDSQKVTAPVGWSETERRAGVELEISVHCWLLPELAEDNLEETLDYATLVEVVNRCAAEECRLLETLANKILNEVQDAGSWRLKAVDVEIRKPNPPIAGFNARCTGISVRWEHQN